MPSRLLLLGLCLSVILVGSLSAADDDAPPPSPSDNSGPGFKPLYNGKDLTGWKVLDGSKEAWKADGELLSCVAEGGGWLRTAEMYSDFVLRMEFRIPPGGNSGVGLRFPEKGNPAFAGMEIQILDDDADKYKDLKDSQYSGSIYSEVAAKRGALKPTGEFNSYEITCKGPQIKVVLNGKTIAEANIDDYKKASGKYKPLAERPRIGYLGMQSHGSRVDFRNIEIKDLTKPVVDPNTRVAMQYVDLVEGKGPAVPPGARVTMLYTGRLVDGKVFDSSRDKNKLVIKNFPLARLIPGWQLGVPGMKVGGRRKLIIPHQLAYGEAGFPDVIPPKATLVFDIELLDFE